MNYDEFAFFNQQLAAMVRDGLPLEGAMQRLCGEMRQGPLRQELEALGADLAKGMPLREAIQLRHLPDLYRQMLQVGAQTNDLPGVLTLLADHYQRRQLIWTRLKGLMVYPTIVLFAAFLLSCFFTFLLKAMARGTAPTFQEIFYGIGRGASPPMFIGLWLAPTLLGCAAVVLLVAVSSPTVRRSLRWRLPAFKEASLAQVASALALMLKSGVPLDNALGLVEQLERGTPAETEITAWRRQLAGGHGKFSEMAAGGRVFPPLFVWMAGQSGEDLPAGFQRAAEVYQSRASYRVETLLYSALPCSILVLGLVILSQVQPVLAMFISFMNAIGGSS
ncbi:MAG: type II secretion system F family protein [Verrucomicrobiota bacterium]|jgi:type II secretory pathway component PulF